MTTEHKTVQMYNERFFGGAMQVYLVPTFGDFKGAFLQAQASADILIVGSNSGVQGWDDDEARAFMLRNSQIPSMSSYDWMAPYVLVAMAKVGQEQGEWAARTALRIIDGTPVTDIPVTQNQIGNLILNLDMADRLDVVFFPSIFRNADEIIGIEE